MLNSKKTVKQNKGSKKFLQPPALYSFDLLSSMSSQDKQQKIPERIEVLSNVEQKSYFSCEESDIKPQQPLIGTSELDQKQNAHLSKKSLKIQDQAIIVVQEEGDLASNNGEDSVILEHVQFKSETHLHENTPNWDHEQDVHHEDSIEEHHPWMKKEEENASNSFNPEFSNSQINIRRNRASKKTCVDIGERKQLMDLENDIKQTNRSCFAKPIESSKDFKVGAFDNKQKGYQNDSLYQVEHLLEKERVRTSQEAQDNQNYLTDDRLGLQIKKNFYLPEERNEKNGRNQNQLIHGLTLQQKQREKVHIEVQTELSGNELLKNEAYLNQQIDFLKSRMKKIQEQNGRLKQINDQINQNATLNQGISQKEKEILQLKRQKVHKDQRFNLEIKRLSDKISQYQKLISMQNNLIKEYQEASQNQTKLSKLQSTNINSRSIQKVATFGKHSDSLRLYELQNSVDKDTHRQCKRQIQELQEYIFDLQQRMARLDTQAQKKIETEVAKLERQISQRLNEQYRDNFQAMKEELAQSKDLIKKLQKDNKISMEQWTQKQSRLKNREIQVNKMYEELSKEWKINQIQKNERKVNQRSKQHGNYYSPKTATQQSKQYFQAAKDFGDSRTLRYQYSSKDMKSIKTTQDLLSFSKRGANDFLKGDRSIEKSISSKDLLRHNHRQRFISPSKPFLQDTLGRQTKQPFKMNSANVQQLSLINRKIQKLRNQITRQLDSIQ